MDPFVEQYPRSVPCGFFSSAFEHIPFPLLFLQPCQWYSAGDSNHIPANDAVSCRCMSLYNVHHPLLFTFFFSIVMMVQPLPFQPT
jgi:hypothetical protein